MKSRRRQQNIQRDLKDPPRRGLRTSVRTRRRNTGPERGGFSLDTDRVRSSGDRSVRSDGGAEGNQALASLPSGVCETKFLTNGSPGPSGGDVVLLLDGRGDKVSELDSEETRQTPVTPELAGRIPVSAGAGDTSSAGFDRQLDDSLSEDTVTSGPSSPHNTTISLKCRECKRLFSRMRRQGPPKPTKRNNDPASLSCDNWVLKKAWHPQRQRQVKGRLWVHLKRIRKLAAERANGAWAYTAQGFCSRLHIFLQRNLRHCVERSANVRDASESHVASRPRRRRRAKSAWPPLGTRQPHKSRAASLDGSSTVLDLSAQDPTVDAGAVELGAHPALQEKALRRPRADPDAAGFLGEQADGAHLEGTRRVLRFDSTASLVTMETQEPGQERAGGRLCEGPAHPLLTEGETPHGSQKGLLDDSNGFRTPPELPSVESKIVRKSRTLRSTQNSSFRSMLATLEKSRNQIIKETDK